MFYQYFIIILALGFIYSVPFQNSIAKYNSYPVLKWNLFKLYIIYKNNNKW